MHLDRARRRQTTCEPTSVPSCSAAGIVGGGSSRPCRRAALQAPSVERQGGGVATRRERGRSTDRGHPQTRAPSRSRPAARQPPPARQPPFAPMTRCRRVPPPCNDPSSSAADQWVFSSPIQSLLSTPSSFPGARSRDGSFTARASCPRSGNTTTPCTQCQMRQMRFGFPPVWRGRRAGHPDHTARPLSEPHLAYPNVPLTERPRIGRNRFFHGLENTRAPPRFVSVEKHNADRWTGRRRLAFIH